MLYEGIRSILIGDRGVEQLFDLFRRLLRREGDDYRGDKSGDGAGDDLVDVDARGQRSCFGEHQISDVDNGSDDDASYRSRVGESLPV